MALGTQNTGEKKGGFSNQISRIKAAADDKFRHSLINNF